MNYSCYMHVTWGWKERILWKCQGRRSCRKVNYKTEKKKKMCFKNVKDPIWVSYPWRGRFFWPLQPCIQRVRGCFAGDKVAETWSWPLSSISGPCPVSGLSIWNGMLEPSSSANSRLVVPLSSRFPRVNPFFPYTLDFGFRCLNFPSWRSTVHISYI